MASLLGCEFGTYPSTYLASFMCWKCFKEPLGAAVGKNVEEAIHDEIQVSLSIYIGGRDGCCLHCFGARYMGGNCPLAAMFSNLFICVLTLKATVAEYLDRTGEVALHFEESQ